MALAAEQVQLVRSSGGLLMGPGTPYTVLPEWDPWSRTVRDPQTTDRPHAHGSLVGSEWVDAAVALIPISVYRNRSSKADWLAAHQALAAAFSAVGDSGETCELRFEWGGTEYVLFGRPRMPRVTTENVAVGKSVEQCVFVAADPRIYSGSLTSVSTGLPLQQGGLTAPLTAPFTVAGTLAGGRETLTNAGTAPAPVRFRIDGPVPEPRIVLTGSDGVQQVIDFDLTLRAGQWLEIDSVARTALLNGLPGSNQRGRAEWTMRTYPLAPGESTLRFFAADFEADAQLTAESRSAFW